MLIILLPPPALRLPLLLSLLPSPSVLLLLLLLQVLYNRKHKRYLYPPCGPNRSLSLHRPSCPRAVSAYQECPTGVNTSYCNVALLEQETVDCLADSDTSLTDHYHRCLAAVCDVDASALNATLAYIEHNCGEDGKFETLAIISYLIFRVV